MEHKTCSAACSHEEYEDSMDTFDEFNDLENSDDDEEADTEHGDHLFDEEEESISCDDARAAGTVQTAASPQMFRLSRSASSDAPVVIEEGVHACPVEAISQANVSVSAYRQTRRYGKPIALQRSDELDWKTVPSSKGYVLASHTRLTQPWLQNLSIPVNRFAKFQQKVNPDKVKDKVIGNVSACVIGCTKGCSGKFTLDEIVQCRLSCFETATTEQAVTEHLVSRLKQVNPIITEPPMTQNIAYKINGKPTCSVFWAAAYGASEDKMKGVRNMLRHNTKIKVHGNKGTKKPTTQYGRCYSFWHHFFETNCQRPNDELRLFPVNNSLKYIYENYFIPWLAKVVNKEDEGSDSESANLRIPSFSYFKKARWHADFQKVSRRAKHYHCLCKTCDSLQTRRLRGFSNKDQEAQWRQIFDAHEAEKLGWRRLEQTRENNAKANPAETLLVQYDDTIYLPIPKLSNRDIKNVTSNRLRLTPFNICNYSTGESAYVYSVKNRYKKNGNHLSSVLYHVLRQVKYSDHESRNARALYLQADNASLNKNNVLFQFLLELIHKQWFDEIYLEYGPPGHTHNGRDAVHFIHNRIAGNFFSFTLGEFQNKWKHSWEKKGTMPDAVILDAQYDFKARYKECKPRKISGFTSTKNDLKAAYAFRFQRGKSNIIQVHWKKAASDAFWLGADHQVESPGFILLSKFPGTTGPDIIPSAPGVTAESYIALATGDTMEKIATDHLGSAELASASMEWIRTSLRTGSMPYTLIPDQPIHSKADWGPSVKVGVLGHEGDFYVLQADENATDFWTLPVDLKNRSDSLNTVIQKARESIAEKPNVRYSDVPAGSARQLQKVAEANSKASANDLLISVENKEEENKEPPPREYGADVKLCEQGNFAVILVKYAGVHGVEIVEITKVNKVGVKVGYETFEGDVYGPSSKTNTETKEKCLSGVWNKKIDTPRRRPKQTRAAKRTRQDVDDEETPLPKEPKLYNCYDVLTYFVAFNKNRRLPGRVVNDIKATAHLLKIPLFVEKEDEDSSDCSNEGDSSDDDEEEDDEYDEDDEE